MDPGTHTERPERSERSIVDDDRIERMDPELERALRGLEEAAEFARSYRFELTDDYLALVARVEAMPQNQSGADKSNVRRGLQAYRLARAQTR